MATFPVVPKGVMQDACAQLCMEKMFREDVFLVGRGGDIRFDGKRDCSTRRFRQRFLSRFLSRCMTRTMAAAQLACEHAGRFASAHARPFEILQRGRREHVNLTEAAALLACIGFSVLREND